MLMGARIASADEVWFQSYQRGSASEACVAQPGETPWQDSWGANPGWSPSWEQWANNGNGGWVCSRSITWARDAAARVYNLGDIGPGGGLVFYIDSTSGLRFEMAPKTWGANETTGIQWCSDWTNSVTTGTAVGDGSANTTAMLTNAGAFVACTSSAPNAVRAYAGGGFTDWFLPSQDELNAMCNYSRTWVGSPLAPPTGACTGVQNGAFSTGAYGFSTNFYSSSSQYIADRAWSQNFSNGFQGHGAKSDLDRVRPVRSF